MGAASAPGATAYTAKCDVIRPRPLPTPWRGSGSRNCIALRAAVSMSFPPITGYGTSVQCSVRYRHGRRHRGPAWPPRSCPARSFVRPSTCVSRTPPTHPLPRSNSTRRLTGPCYRRHTSAAPPPCHLLRSRPTSWPRPPAPDRRPTACERPPCSSCATSLCVHLGLDVALAGKLPGRCHDIRECRPRWEAPHPTTF